MREYSVWHEKLFEHQGISWVRSTDSFQTQVNYAHELQIYSIFILNLEKSGILTQYALFLCGLLRKHFVNIQQDFMKMISRPTHSIASCEMFDNTGNSSVNDTVMSNVLLVVPSVVVNVKLITIGHMNGS